MSGEIEAANLPLDEKVYLKKDYFGWRVVEKPSKWWHYVLGSKKNLVILMVIMFIAICFYFGVKEILANQKAIILASCNTTIFELNQFPP
jgi:hypothetical protein